MREWPAEPSLRFLIQCSLRLEKWCQGGPSQCPDGDGESPCENCWKEKTKQAAGSGTSAGRLIARAQETEYALGKRVHLTLADIPADEWLVLQMIDQERSRLQTEEQLTIPKLNA